MLKQLFCKHDYKLIHYIPCTFNSRGTILKVPISLYECSRCGHRRVKKADNYFYHYTILDQVKMWKKGEYTFLDEEVNEFTN